MQRKQCAYEIQGIAQMDYLELFKKFGYSYGPQETYKLDHIAHVVLGENVSFHTKSMVTYTLFTNTITKSLLTTTLKTLNW